MSSSVSSSCLASNPGVVQNGVVAPNRSAPPRRCAESGRRWRTALTSAAAFGENGRACTDARTQSLKLGDGACDGPTSTLAKSTPTRVPGADRQPASSQLGTACFQSAIASSKFAPESLCRQLRRSSEVCNKPLSSLQLVCSAIVGVPPDHGGAGSKCIDPVSDRTCMKTHTPFPASCLRRSMTTSTSPNKDGTKLNGEQRKKSRVGR